MIDCAVQFFYIHKETIFNFIYQLIGYVGLAIGILSNYWPKKDQILKLSFVNTSLFVLHYLLLGQINGAIVDTLSAIRQVAALYTSHIAVVSAFYLVPFIMLGYHHDPLMPAMSIAIASLIGTCASFQPTAQRLRAFNMMASPFWFFYNYRVGSWAGMTGDVLGLLSNASSYYYYRRQELRLLTTHTYSLNRKEHSSCSNIA